MTYQIVRYNQALRPGVVSLYRYLISEDPALNDSYFRWKHEENPYMPEPLLYVAIADREVVGMRGFQGAQWQYGKQQRVSWPIACDLAIAPAHRDRKLFRQIMSFALADLAAKGYAATVNLSANPITYAASLRSRWRLVGTFSACEIQTTRAKHARQWRNAIARLPLAWRYARVPVALLLKPGFERFDAAWAERAGHDRLEIQRTSRPEAMSALVARCDSRRIRHVRDAVYYEWRFRNPSCDYRFVFWRNRSSLDAFIVLQLWRTGDAADIRIVDWDATRPEILEAMLSRIVEVGGYDTLSIWSIALPPELVEKLRKLGFQHKRDIRGLREFRPGLLVIGADGAPVANSAAQGLGLFSSLDRWNLRMVYSDAY